VPIRDFNVILQSDAYETEFAFRMSTIHQIRLFLAFILLTPGFQACHQIVVEKPHIAYVNSYHRGHPSSDEIMDAILHRFPRDSFEVQYHFMDSKRNSSITYIEQRASEIFDSILLQDPDILIVSDDNAVKYLVKPNLNLFDFPVVFCGVNLTASPYELPKNRVTGMLEILPLAEVLHHLKSHDPALTNLLVLTENTTTSRKEKELLDSLYRKAGFEAEYAMVETFDTWKSVFREANHQYDLIYTPTQGAIQGWDADEAAQFVHEHLKVPVFSCEDFMMPYVVFGITKIAAEQGEWAANAARSILQGMETEEIPEAVNKQSKTWLNKRLANKIDFRLDSIDVDEILE
jgi:ABC-type uncharacterized transport system substrate-binding protein